MSEETTSLPPKVNPLGDTPAAEAPKVKPVLRKPVLGGAVHPAMPKPPAAPAQPAAAPASSAVEQLKTITQNLKSITAPIPQQAILRNTGIIGSQEMTEAQKAAAKARTSRIALSEAIGAASVKDESAPIKTIKIQRPKIVPGARPAQRPPVVPQPSAAAAPAPEPPREEPASAPSADSVSITQKKTLKLSRPGVASRPKFGIKKPGAPAAKAPAKPQEASGGEVAELEPVGDIPDIPATPQLAPQELPQNVIPAVPKGVAIAGVILQIAACAVIGVLAYFLYQDTQLPYFCGGCTPP